MQTPFYTVFAFMEDFMKRSKDEYLKEIDSVIENGYYKDNWQSLASHKTPQWYYNGKFGIFIHWGIYSVPAFGNEWYSRNMYDKNVREFEHHIKTYGLQKDFGYKDFIEYFNGEKFDADSWVTLFKNAGAKFVMPVAEHHDGFAMYATDFNRWNSVNMGPKVDVLENIKSACEKHNLTFCASSHRAEHYFFMNTGRTIESDVNDEKFADFYGPAVLNETLSPKNVFNATEDTYAQGASDEWLCDWMVRTCEIIDKYKPQILYFDWWIHNKTFKPYLKKIAAYYYNRALSWDKEVTINYKHEAFALGVGTFDVERGALTGISPVPWQTDTAIGKLSWGYRKDNEYKTARQIICDLIDIVSKNGMLLLNVGPKSDGTITEEETEVLTQIGKWMNVNSDGIYETTPWKKFGEGKINCEEGFFKDSNEKNYTSSDFRFTYKNGCIYAFQMKPDTNSEILIKSLARKETHDFLIESVLFMTSCENVDYFRDSEGLHILLNENPKSDLPICFRIEIN